MPAVNHPSYKQELKHSKETIAYVKKTLESIHDLKSRLDEDIEYSKKHLSSDSSQDYVTLMINESIRNTISLKLRNLLVAQNKPYFARIDFKETHDTSTENLYIGKMSLMRDEDQKVIIVDWRAPIANLYYEGRLGEASYVCPGGAITGELSLKRQVSINGGILEEIFDVDITTNDEFLQAYLGASADNRLKEIVSTIQVEQNKIIRADMWNPLIVQGAAGSGKTTIALHRIAYLIYAFEKSFDPDNFMIIAPNRFFLNYISEVLPELGVEKVKQTTFEEFAIELIGKKLKVKDPLESLTTFINHNNTALQIDKNNYQKRCSEVKSSMVFKEIIDHYVHHVEANFIPKENFKIANQVIFKYDEINNLFVNQYKNWPIMLRIAEIKKYLTNRLKTKKEALIYHFEEVCDTRIMYLKDNELPSDERQKKIIAEIDTKNDLISKLEGYAKKAVGDYIKKISKINPHQYYVDFITNEELYNEIINTKIADTTLSAFIREHTLSVLNAGLIELEDVAPILYLKFCIYGMDEKILVKHIVIDEAQDFSVFQFYVLKRIVKDSSFTILGDLCQSIHSYRGISSWKDVMEQVFMEKKNEFITLEQSYRTTVEIMDMANIVIRKIPELVPMLAKTVIRHGDPVKIIKQESLQDIALDISDKIKHFQSLKYKSIAMIGKTMEECQEVFKILHNQLKELRMITGKEQEYKSGLVIVPSYLAKGLEFDVVFIINANNEQYTEDELDIKLLYVSMTRALHQLYIYYHGQLCALMC